MYIYRTESFLVVTLKKVMRQVNSNNTLLSIFKVLAF